MLFKKRKNQRQKNEVVVFLKKHILTIIVLLIFIVGVVATAIIVNRESANAPEEGGAIAILTPTSESRIAMYNPKSFDPLASSDQDVVYLNYLVYGYLFRLDNGLNVYPDLVEDYIPNRERGSVEITLRNGLSFSDGTPLTASDVEFTINTILNLGKKSPYFNYVKRIESVRVDGNNNLYIEFINPLDASLDNLVFPIVSAADYYTSDFKVGAGPYKYADYNPERNLELLPNTYYHDTIPEIPVIINIVKNKDMLAGLVTMDDVTAYLSTNISSDDIAKDKSLRCRFIPSGELEYIGFNCNNPLLSDNRMRQAIAYAIDRDEIISDDYAGGVLLSDSMYFPGFLGVDDEDPIHHDYKKAASIFKSLGYSDINEDKFLETPEGENFTLRILMSNESAPRKDAAATIKKSLATIGINVEVIPLAPSELSMELKEGNFDLYIAGISIDKQFKLSELFNEANYGGFNDQTVISLVGELEQCLTSEEQKAVFIALKPQLNSQLPYFSIGYKAYYFVSVPSLSVTEGPLFFDPYRDIAGWTWQRRTTVEE